ncbi:MAG: 50S ribosomal protein L23 [Candidatus Berkelbacteria bacterium]
MRQILKKAIVSEKSFQAAAKATFTFLVDTSATKQEIAEKFETVFSIKPLSINTITIMGKVKKGKKGPGRRSDIKKAVITCAKGTKIDLFETEEEAKDKDKDKKKK